MPTQLGGEGEIGKNGKGGKGAITPRRRFQGSTGGTGKKKPFLLKAT